MHSLFQHLHIYAAELLIVAVLVHGWALPAALARHP